MIRRLLTAFAAFILSLSCAFGLVACNGKDGADGKDGVDGKDGTGISQSYIDDNGDLIIILTDGTQINCGNVRPQTDGTDGLYYLEVKEGGKTVGYSVRSIGAAAERIIKIPSAYNGLPVVSVGEGAFAGCEWLTDVVIPDSVKTIGEKAFYGCPSLISVTVGSGVGVSGSYAFGRCENLERVYVSDLGKWCSVDFSDPSANPLYFADKLYVNGELATDIIIPDGTAAIGNYAFYGCSGLKSVKTGSGVTSIGDESFIDCYDLESVVIGDGVTSIGDSAFANCFKLSSLTLGSKIKTIADYAFSCCTALTRLTFPSSVESIGECAFVQCMGLTEINLNYGLKSIGDCAFGGCTEIQSFIMPDSVTEIGFGILMFAEGGGFGGGAVYNNLKELVISNSLKEIPDFSFNGCNMTDVVIGNSVETIRYSSFYACTQLKNVIIPKSVKKIESYAFYQCPSLEYVFYGGNLFEWSAMSIGSKGNEITSATVCFYSEQPPAMAGNYWHYVNGQPVLW